MTLGTTRDGKTVEMERARHSSWRLLVDRAQYGPLQSFAACVVVSQRLIPVANRAL